MSRSQKAMLLCGGQFLEQAAVIYNATHESVIFTLDMPTFDSCVPQVQERANDELRLLQTIRSDSSKGFSQRPMAIWTHENKSDREVHRSGKAQPLRLFRNIQRGSRDQRLHKQWLKSQAHSLIGLEFLRQD